MVKQSKITWFILKERCKMFFYCRLIFRFQNLIKVRYVHCVTKNDTDVAHYRVRQ